MRKREKAKEEKELKKEASKQRAWFRKQLQISYNEEMKIIKSRLGRHWGIGPQGPKEGLDYDETR